jgi:hypothetical protein
MPKTKIIPSKKKFKAPNENNMDHKIGLAYAPKENYID